MNQSSVTNRRIRIFCVDDNEMVGRALERRLGREPDLEWLGMLLDGAAARARIAELKPDIVLLDIDMPGVDTFLLAQQLSTEVPESRVVMFSGHVTPEFVERAINNGAWGYISKNDDVARIIEGIRSAARGEIALGKEAHDAQWLANKRIKSDTERGPR